ncbi:hypothetical protein [Mucilaginibacter sp. OK098]|uniref:hypothetical protein n=1 Tax=Mucilaginibacter sp. OK098 TaxID=1855297 RepID=UPI0009223894|nr:hypothetical protein [Mucilaginibacter sp. OK098]SHN23137.1 hypothetical protein SAMN05216524_1072 [Mucilaginibacter sp. OK098]
MRKFLYLIFLISAAFIISSWMGIAVNKKIKHKFLVTGSIMQTVSYCSGARPAQKILDSCNTPKGISFGKLFIKSGVMNIEGAPVIHEIKADSNGNFSTYLPAGNYCLLEEWKTKPFKLPLNNVNQTVDSACFRNLYNAADFNLKITNKSIHHMKFVFHRTCPYNQPCVSYRGSLPQ